MPYDITDACPVDIKSNNHHDDHLFIRKRIYCKDLYILFYYNSYLSQWIQTELEIHSLYLKIYLHCCKEPIFLKNLITVYR